MNSTTVKQYAKVIDNRITRFYETNSSLYEFTNIMKEDSIFLDVTGTNVKMGDRVELGPNGYVIINDELDSVPKKDYSVNDIDKTRFFLLIDLDNKCQRFLHEAFLCQSLLHVKVSTELEKEALEYKKTGKAGKLLIDVSEIDNISLDEASNQIMQTYNRIIEANNKVVPYYYKFRNYIQSATTIDELRQIQRELYAEKI